MSQAQIEGSPPSNGEIKNEVQPTQPAGDPATAAPNPPQPQRTTMETFLTAFKSLFIRALIIYLVVSYFKKTQAPATTTGSIDNNIAGKPAKNLFSDGLPIALHIYLSESEELNDFSVKNLIWYKNKLKYGDWTSGPNGDGTYYFEKEIPVTENMRNNGSLYIHAFVTKEGESPNPKAENYGKAFVSSVTKQLNRYKKLKNSGTKNLLTGTSEKEIVEEGKIVSHWHPNFTLNLVTDQTQWTYGAVPSPINQFIMFTNDGKYYKPVLWANDFWNMARDYKPLNETIKTFKIRLFYQPISIIKWQLYAAQNTKYMWNQWGSDNQVESDEEQDTFKEALLDTNPYLLGITIFVSILHSVFELLAFKNDIQFWNNRNSLEGLSVRSVFFSVFQSIVVLLYVLDNDTNTLIRFSCFISLLIELWKIYKVVDIKFENGWITFKDKGSYVESSTKQYDNLAFKYLSWVCFPLLIGYSIYALLYLEHKGWYSFVLDLLYGYLLTFGFIMMTPQLFINYKLKSVAHLPWRMLTYKFLNTFIDDMFAFVIKMPTMYRLGCFRDDIVFLIFLYQRWIYPVDKSRRNEFGYSEDDAKAIQNKNQNITTVDNKKDN